MTAQSTIPTTAAVSVEGLGLIPSGPRTSDRIFGMGLIVHTTLFLGLTTLFFLLIGKSPFPVFASMVTGAVGSGFAVSETLVKATPVLLCGLATLIPARLGLISVGAEGQLFIGSIGGTAAVLWLSEPLGILVLPAMLLCAAASAAAYGLLAGWLRSALAVNETISTLLLNYIAPLLVSYLVYGPWKDPASLGWPATVPFPDASVLPSLFGTRVHVGLLIGLCAILLASFVLGRTKLGYWLDLLREAPKVARRGGLLVGRATLIVMAVGGACAGIAGIVEVSVIEGRLQPDVGAGAGYAGFLVAWLAKGSPYKLIPLSLLLGALATAGDNLQLFEGLPSAVTYVLQGLLFCSALMTNRVSQALERTLHARS